MESVLFMMRALVMNLLMTPPPAILMSCPFVLGSYCVVSATVLLCCAPCHSVAVLCTLPQCCCVVHPATVLLCVVSCCYNVALYRAP